jgi:hypothetical protein
MIRHVFHASTYEEATELLLRWAIEGVDCKVGGKSSHLSLFPPPLLSITFSQPTRGSLVIDNRPFMG